MVQIRVDRVGGPCPVQDEPDADACFPEGDGGEAPEVGFFRGEHVVHVYGIDVLRKEGIVDVGVEVRDGTDGE